MKVGKSWRSRLPHWRSPGVPLIEDLPSATVTGDEDPASDGGDAASFPLDEGARSSASPVPDKRQPASASRPCRPTLPDRPGRWQLTARDGSTTVHRVIDRNGQLYVVRRGLLAVAVPIAHLEGDWLPLD
jgi:hypothetical protein